MAINVPMVQAYMGAGMNILITGQAGTGKTAILKEAAKNLGMKMKYYSSPTLDPYIDLVGVPMPDQSDPKVKRLDFYRPQDIDDAEIVFFDELNRAESKTLNAVFELIQFKSINGVPMPHLKCVVAAINPVEDGYDTDMLDIALLDRFHIYLSSEVEADYSYLREKYGRTYAMAGCTIFKEYQKEYKASAKTKNVRGYFSPRRLDVMMEAFKVFPKAQTIKDTLPADVVLDTRGVAAALTAALQPVTAANTKTKLAASLSGVDAAHVQAQLSMLANLLRAPSNRDAFQAAYNWALINDPNAASKMLMGLAVALSSGMSPDRIRSNWGSMVDKMTPTMKTMMASNWDTGKRRAARGLGLIP